MKSVMLRGLIAAVVVFGAACDSADALSPATPTISPSHDIAAPKAADAKQAIDQYIWLSCMNGGEGETVRVTGELRYEIHVTQDGTGVFHLNIKSNTSGLTAVGQTTGTLFHGSMAERVKSRGEDVLNSEVRTTDIIRFTAAGSRAAYSLVVTSHFIVEDGAYVLAEQTWNEVCR